MRKLLSLKQWKHVFVLVYKLLRSEKVPLHEKLLFVIPALAYWVMPDALPFLPVDDIAVTMLLAKWFAWRLERKYPVE